MNILPRVSSDLNTGSIRVVYKREFVRFLGDMATADIYHENTDARDNINYCVSICKDNNFTKKAKYYPDVTNKYLIFLQR